MDLYIGPWVKERQALGDLNQFLNHVPLIPSVTWGVDTIPQFLSHVGCRH